MARKKETTNLGKGKTSRKPELKVLELRIPKMASSVNIPTVQSGCKNDL